MPANDDRRVPSIAQLRERVIVGLKHIPLFANASRRLLDDLVANVGIEEATALGVAPAVIQGREPIVLILLERPVVVTSVAFAPIRLLPGTYLRDHPPFGGDTVEAHAWDSSRIRSADTDRSRVFLIDRQRFEHLPKIVFHAMDFTELERLQQYFSP